ncbi:MAG: carbon-nitrogen hydrolase family protein [Candidatus Obscuribacterales bacterium]|nr:carbon-nitrogen hydrolase family protein [Steroidobacteraceae bacterium]
MPRRLRVAAVQLRCGIDSAANRAHAAPFLRAAAAAGAQLVATPENTMRLDRDRKRLLAATAAENNDSELAAWGAFAKELSVWLLMGSGSVVALAGKVFNRSYLFSPTGAVAAHYDKIHMFDVQLGAGESYRESEGVQAGDKAVLAAGPMDAKIGLTICYDLRFPGLYNALARGGAEVIAVPAAFTHTTGQAHWDTLVRARAIETGAFVIAPAQGGHHDDGRTTWGYSMIVDPWGKVLAALDHNNPGYVVADLDLDLVQEARAKIPAWVGGPAYLPPPALVTGR